MRSKTPTNHVRNRLFLFCLVNSFKIVLLKALVFVLLHRTPALVNSSRSIKRDPPHFGKSDFVRIVRNRSESRLLAGGATEARVLAVGLCSTALSPAA